MGEIYFSGDSHFSHKNILTYCNRDFQSIDEHDESLIQSWNKTVSLTSTIYYLGDFCFGKDAIKYLERLNGVKKFLYLPFSHDKFWLKSSFKNPRLTSITFLNSIEEIKIDGLYYTLSHYPLASWPRSYHGSTLLYGHSHGNYNAKGKILDVGVDSAFLLLGEYRPFSLNEIKEIIENKVKTEENIHD
jgi:calcineurin-like phosphoesterase family protein